MARRQLPDDIADTLRDCGGLVATVHGGHPRRLHELRSRGLLTRVAHGVYADAEEVGRLDAWRRFDLDSRAFAASCGNGTYLTGWSAAALHGLPLLGRPPRQPTAVRPVAASGGTTRAAYGRVARSRVPPEHLGHFGGVPATGVAWTACVIALTAPLRVGLAVADRAAALGADLPGCLPHVAGRTGVGRARWVSGHADPLAESPLESLGRFAAIEAGLPTLVSNAWVGDGRPRYRVDGLWPHHWAVFEADGAVKYDNRPDASSVVSRQREREWELRRLGLGLCRYDWGLAWGNPSELARRFRHLLSDHPSRGTPVRWWRHDPVRGPVDPGPADWPDPLGNYVAMPPLWWKDRR